MHTNIAIPSDFVTSTGSLARVSNVGTKIVAILSAAKLATLGPVAAPGVC